MDNGSIKVMNLPFKSTVWAIVLSLFLGPLGIAYTKIKASLIMVVLFLLAALVNKQFVYGIYIVWAINIYLSIHFVNRYNKKLLETLSL